MKKNITAMILSSTLILSPIATMSVSVQAAPASQSKSAKPVKAKKTTGVKAKLKNLKKRVKKVSLKRKKKPKTRRNLKTALASAAVLGAGAVGVSAVASDSNDGDINVKFSGLAKKVAAGDTDAVTAVLNSFADSSAEPNPKDTQAFNNALKKKPKLLKKLLSNGSLAAFNQNIILNQMLKQLTKENADNGLLRISAPRAELNQVTASAQVGIIAGDLPDNVVAGIYKKSLGDAEIFSTSDYEALTTLNASADKGPFNDKLKSLVSTLPADKKQLINGLAKVVNKARTLGSDKLTQSNLGIYLSPNLFSTPILNKIKAGATTTAETANAQKITQSIMKSFNKTSGDPIYATVDKSKKTSKVAVADPSLGKSGLIQKQTPEGEDIFGTFNPSTSNKAVTDPSLGKSGLIQKQTSEGEDIFGTF